MAFYSTMDPEQVAELLKPFFEASVVVASEYTKMCRRNTITSTDMEYAMKFAARYVVGIENESLFPEIYQGLDEEYGEEEECMEDDTSDQFERYTGQDPKMKLVNQCHDTWNQWEPQNPLQAAAKNAVEKIYN